jgi:hypothetical protein
MIKRRKKYHPPKEEYNDIVDLGDRFHLRYCGKSIILEVGKEYKDVVGIVEKRFIPFKTDKGEVRYRIDSDYGTKLSKSPLIVPKGENCYTKTTCFVKPYIKNKKRCLIIEITEDSFIYKLFKQEGIKGFKQTGLFYAEIVKDIYKYYWEERQIVPEKDRVLKEENEVNLLLN